MLLPTGLVVAAFTAALAPAVHAAPTSTPLDWTLSQPTSVGKTVVGFLPGTGRNRQLGVSVQGRPAVALAGVPAISMGATPHAGTAADGSLVVVYPRCVTDQGAGCDLYQVGVRGGRERRVTGVNTPGFSELQGAMDHGAVAFLRTQSRRGGFDTDRVSLYRRPAGGEARLMTRAGGYDIALSGTHVAQARYTDEDGGCNAEVEIVDAAGAVRRVKSIICGEGGQSLVSLNFWGGKLTFLYHRGAYGPPSTAIWRTSLHSAALARAAGPNHAVGFAPTSARSGVAYRINQWDEPIAMVRFGPLAFVGPGEKAAQ